MPPKIEKIDYEVEEIKTAQSAEPKSDVVKKPIEESPTPTQPETSGDIPSKPTKDEVDTTSSQQQSTPQKAIKRPQVGLGRRSEERRVGKECRSGWSPKHEK